MGKHFYEIKETDGVLISTEVISILSMCLSFIIIVGMFVGFNSIEMNRKFEPNSYKYKYTCFISCIGFFIFAVVGSVGWTNVLFGITSVSCKIFYILGLISYNIGTISMYWLFSYRLQYIFDNTSLKINKYILMIFRISCLIIPTVLWTLWVYYSYNDLTPHKSESNNSRYEHCHPSRYNIIAQHAAGAIGWIHMLFSLIILSLFIYKLHQVSVMQHTNDHSWNESNLMHNRLLETSKNLNFKTVQKIRRSTLLCLIAIISTWMYVLIVAYIVSELGLFMSLDAVINTMCIYFLFPFSNNIYNKTLVYCETPCLCLCCWNINILKSVSSSDKISQLISPNKNDDNISNNDFTKIDTKPRDIALLHLNSLTKNKQKNPNILKSKNNKGIQISRTKAEVPPTAPNTHFSINQRSLALFRPKQGIHHNSVIHTKRDSTTTYKQLKNSKNHYHGHHHQLPSNHHVLYHASNKVAGNTKNIQHNTINEYSNKNVNGNKNINNDDQKLVFKPREDELDFRPASIKNNIQKLVLNEPDTDDVKISIYKSMPQMPLNDDDINSYKSPHRYRARTMTDSRSRSNTFNLLQLTDDETQESFNDHYSDDEYNDHYLNANSYSTTSTLGGN